MSRPPSAQPTPAELTVLQLLWEHGPLNGPEIAKRLDSGSDSPRAYTSVMSLLGTMVTKRQLSRLPEGRSHIYTALTSRDSTRSGIVKDLVGRVFDGSASQLVAGLLDGTEPDSTELDAIHRAIEAYRDRRSS